MQSIPFNWLSYTRVFQHCEYFFIKIKKPTRLFYRIGQKGEKLCSII
nr:MAG TPA_asm: hypothetical protein [Caudoviricetes sp.]